MAGKNITIAGATFRSVPSIDVPVSGGGTASFVEISDTTAQAADVASGKFFYDAAGVKTEGTASGGGGGASNIVTGTFTGETDGVLEVQIPYTGGGYPIGIHIMPVEGALNREGAYYSTLSQYAIACWYCSNNAENQRPDYTGASDVTTAYGQRNQVYALFLYKSSSSDATAVTRNGATFTMYNQTDPTNTRGDQVRMPSATKMRIRIKPVASNGYGFPVGVPFRYCVIYSE